MGIINSNVDTLLRNDLDDAYEDMAYGGNFAALLGLFKKEEFNGDAKKVPLKIGFGAGNSATAATAYANAGLAARQAFIVNPFYTNAQAQVDLKQAAYTGGDNSVVALLMDEVKTCLDSVRMQADTAMGATGYGELGTIASSTGSGPYVLTLLLTSDVNHVQNYVGSTFVSKATVAAASLDTGTFTITAVAPSQKTITVTANSSWTPTNNHVFGLAGTMAASASPIAWPGIPGWIPPAASRPIATNDSFNNVNRSISETLLAGSALDISGASGGGVQSIVDGINTLDATIADVPGANPDVVVMSFQNKGKVKASLQTQNRYNSGEVQGQDISVFYKSIKFDGVTGEMDIVSSSNWPSNLVAILDKSTWTIGSPQNKPFQPDTADGNPVFNIPGAGAAGISYRANFLMWCNAPGKNGMLTVKSS